MEALRQFQLRVLSLIEIWLKKQPHSPLLPLCVLPMLRALRSAARPSGYPPLAKRLSHLLTTHLAGCTPALPADLTIPMLDTATVSQAAQAEGVTTGGADALARLLAKTMYFATREDSADVRKAATRAYTCLFRAVGNAAASGGAPAQALFAAQCSAAVTDVLVKRKSRWTHTTLRELVKACPEAAPLVLCEAMPHAQAARTEFVRVEALQTCALCLRCGPVGSWCVLLDLGTALCALARW